MEHSVAKTLLEKISKEELNEIKTDLEHSRSRHDYSSVLKILKVIQKK
jgi:hypothetical protein